MSSIKFATFITQLFPLLIVILSLTSGYTTYHGLSYFIPKWIALALTVSVQTIIVMATLLFARSYFNTNSWRLMGAFSCLVFAAFVSIFFSYFKFVESSDASIRSRQKFTALSERVQTFVDDVHSAKSKQIKVELQKIKTSKEKAECELGRCSPDQRPAIIGPGRRYKLYMGDVKLAEKRLKNLQQSGTAETQAGMARALLVRVGAEGMRNKSNYLKFQDLLSAASEASDQFAVTIGAPPIDIPELIEFNEYIQITPSFRSLREPSWLPLLLATLVDFFTIILSYWLEQNPFGKIDRRDRDRLMRVLLTFTQWSINSHDQLEFRLSKTEEERVEGVNDAMRQCVATQLLNKGYLRRVDTTKAEFAPALYDVLNTFFRDNDTKERS